MNHNFKIGDNVKHATGINLRVKAIHGDTITCFLLCPEGNKVRRRTLKRLLFNTDGSPSYETVIVRSHNISLDA